MGGKDFQLRGNFGEISPSESEVSTVKETEWKQVIVEQMNKVGTYRDAFEPAIDSLAKMLEQRDAVYAKYISTGAHAVVKKKSDRGAENMVVNPLLRTWRELNGDALAYWRDLGLTPAGLKRIDEKAMQKPKENALAKALREFG